MTLASVVRTAHPTLGRDISLLSILWCAAHTVTTKQGALYAPTPRQIKWYHVAILLHMILPRRTIVHTLVRTAHPTLGCDISLLSILWCAAHTVTTGRHQHH